MAGFNRVIMMGKVCSDPILRETKRGGHICKFRMMTVYPYRNPDNREEWLEEVCYVACHVFHEPAKKFHQYIRRGLWVLIEGRLTLHRWETPEGERRSMHSIRVHSWKFTTPNASNEPVGDDWDGYPS